MSLGVSRSLHTNCYTTDGTYIILYRTVVNSKHTQYNKINVKSKLKYEKLKKKLRSAQQKSTTLRWFFYRSRNRYTANAANAGTTTQERVCPGAALQLSSSQKHMCPVPVPSIMHTWSTMNRLICNLEVHVRLMLSYAVGTTRM